MADDVTQDDIKEMYDYINRSIQSVAEDLSDLRSKVYLQGKQIERRLSRLEANANWDPSLTDKSFRREVKQL